MKRASGHQMVNPSLIARNGKMKTMESLERIREDKSNKLKQLKAELAQLENNSHPEYLAVCDMLGQVHAERERACDIELEHGLELIDHDFRIQQQDALREFEKKKDELKDKLISDLIKQKNDIDNTMHYNELTDERPDMEPEEPTNMVKKLRPRFANTTQSSSDRIRTSDKKKVLVLSQVSLALDDEDILQDLSVLRDHKEVKDVDVYKEFLEDNNLKSTRNLKNLEEHSFHTAELD